MSSRGVSEESGQPVVLGGQRAERGQAAEPGAGAHWHSRVCCVCVCVCVCLGDTLLSAELAQGNREKSEPGFCQEEQRVLMERKKGKSLELWKTVPATCDF